MIIFDFLGNIRRFRRVCEHIQAQVCSRNVGINLGGQSRAAPPSPRASRKFTTEMSESSSCGSDTSERLFLSPHPATRQVVCFNKVVHHLPPPSPTYHYRDNYYIIIIFGNVIVLHGNQLPKVKIVYLLTIVSILTNCHKLSQITTYVSQYINSS